MTLPDGESLINAVIEQRIAEMSDQDFNALVSRRRPPADANPKPAKGTHVPNVGRSPSTPPGPTSDIAAAEAAGDWKRAGRLKVEMLMQRDPR
jgi:hypothetical protein